MSLREVPTPVPAPDEVLIRVHAATGERGGLAHSYPRRTGGLIIRALFGWSRPKQPILGTDVAGVITAVGKEVTGFSPGQGVLAFQGMRTGCHAEYVCVKQDAAIVHKPDGVSFEDAAALCFGGTTALHFTCGAGALAAEAPSIEGRWRAVSRARAVRYRPRP